MAYSRDDRSDRYHEMSSKQWEEQGKRGASNHNIHSNHREEEEEAIRSLISDNTQTGGGGGGPKPSYFSQGNNSKIPSINSRSFNLTGSLRYSDAQAKQSVESPGPKYGFGAQAKYSYNNGESRGNPSRGFSPITRNGQQEGAGGGIGGSGGGIGGMRTGPHFAFGNNESGPTVSSAHALIDSHPGHKSMAKNSLLSQSLQANSMQGGGGGGGMVDNGMSENKNLNGISAYASLRRPNTSGGLSTKNGIVRPSMANISSLFTGGKGNTQQHGGLGGTGSTGGGGHTIAQTSMDYPQLHDDQHSQHPNPGSYSGSYFSNSFNKGGGGGNQNFLGGGTGTGRNNTHKGEHTQSKQGRPKSSTIGWMADGFGGGGQGQGISVGGVQSIGSNGYSKK